MRKEDRLLLILAHPSLDQCQISEASGILQSGIDVDYLIRKVFENRIFLQAYEHISAMANQGMTGADSFLKRMRNPYRQLMATNLAIRQESMRVLRVLSKNHIMFTPIKGFLLDALIYPKNVTRELSDTDLLFPNEKERLKAKELLSDLGYKKQLTGRYAYHYKMYKWLFGIEVNIELHSSLPGITLFYQYPLIEDLWASLAKEEIDGTPVLVMPREYMFLVVALNAFKDGNLKLKDISDMIAITAPSQGFDWLRVKSHARKLAWSYMLAIPLLSLYKTVSLPEKSLKSAALNPGEGGSSQAGNYEPEVYPIHYSSYCNRIGCQMRCRGCIFEYPKEVSEQELQSVSDVFTYFPTRLRQSLRFIVTFVRRDYGSRYALRCAFDMTLYLLNISVYMVKIVL